MNILLTTAAALATAAGLALTFAPRDGFETSTWIDAAPETVWSVLADPSGHADWNPSMRSIQGEFAAGERIRIEMPMGDGTMVFRPRVLTAEAGRELRWLGRLWVPGLFDGEHHFILTPENGGTRLTHGEGFSGVLLWVMDVQQFIPAFEATNAALKARAEALSDA